MNGNERILQSAQVFPGDKIQIKIKTGEKEEGIPVYEIYEITVHETVHDYRSVYVENRETGDRYYSSNYDAVSNNSSFRIRETGFFEAGVPLSTTPTGSGFTIFDGGEVLDNGTTCISIGDTNDPNISITGSKGGTTVCNFHLTGTYPSRSTSSDVRTYLNVSSTNGGTKTDFEVSMPLSNDAGQIRIEVIFKASVPIGTFVDHVSINADGKGLFSITDDISKDDIESIKATKVETTDPDIDLGVVIISTN